MQALKKYGQNFLKNKDILNIIAKVVDTNDNDLIIEVGSGMGALTYYLINKNTYYLGYEIDNRMSDYLDKYLSNKVKIIYKDFLNCDIKEDIKNIKYENIFVIANIPYYITSPIIMKLINSNINFQNIVLLVQKEFGERLFARENSKEYNAFTIMVNYFYDVKKVMDVGRNNFSPVPNVDSVVINMERKDYELLDNIDEYFLFLRDAFHNKRKTLRNNLSGYDWKKVSSVLNYLGYKENVRAEEISMDNFLELWKKITSSI